jgi:hypothetical protein
MVQGHGGRRVAVQVQFDRIEIQLVRINAMIELKMQLDFLPAVKARGEIQCGHPHGLKGDLAGGAEEAVHPFTDGAPAAIGQRQSLADQTGPLRQMRRLLHPACSGTELHDAAGREGPQKIGPDMAKERLGQFGHIVVDALFDLGGQKGHAFQEAFHVGIAILEILQPQHAGLFGKGPGEILRRFL